MNPILYHGAPNGPSFTALAALIETGVDADLRPIDLAAGARHAAGMPRATEVAMSIEGEGPVLVVDGVAMADSVFIACYLDDVGRAPIRPRDPYARWEMMAWCRYVVERIAPAASLLGTRAFLHDRLRALSDREFAALLRSIESHDLRARWEAARNDEADAAAIAASRDRIAAGVARLEQTLGDREWLIGEFSIADLESYAWLAGMVSLVPGAFDPAPQVARWLARMQARPAVAAALALAGEVDPSTIWAPGPEISRWG